MMAEKRKEAVHEPKGRQSREQTSERVACPDCFTASRRAQSAGFLPKARFDREPVSLLKTTNQGTPKDSASICRADEGEAGIRHQPLVEVAGVMVMENSRPPFPPNLVGRMKRSGIRHISSCEAKSATSRRTKHNPPSLEALNTLTSGPHPPMGKTGPAEVALG